MQDLGGEGFFLSQQPEKQMLGSDVFVRKSLGFFGGVGEHALAFVAEGQIDRCRHFLSNRRVGLRFAF